MFQRHPLQNEAVMLITTNTLNRRPTLSHPPHAREAVETLYRVQQLYPFFLFGFVIMPDHCHLLLRVPEPLSISTIMRVYKYGVSSNIGIGPIWQSRFHIRLTDRSWQALEYIHQNPVKAGLVEQPEDYQWSSACGKWDITSLEC